jgi:hypothetical protein
MNSTRTLGCIGLLGLAAILALAAGPCVEERALDNDLGHFRVTVTRVDGTIGGDGSRADPWDYPDGDVTFTYNATAYDRRGQIMDGQQGRDSYDGLASVWVNPRANTGFPKTDSAATSVQFAAGRVEAAQISARNLYGRANVQLADVQDEEVEPVQGMLRQIPQFARAGSFALGVSRDYFFDPPSLHNVQIDDFVRHQADIDTSPLPRRFVEIDCRLDTPAQGLPDDGHGKLLVTGLFNEGFFVTDLADTARGFNHLYVYNYSYPEGLVLGDRLDRLVGTSADFSGATQISFPSWLAAMDEHHDPAPFRVADLDALLPPVLVTADMCRDGGGSSQHLCGHSKQNWMLEDLESARVRLENLRAPDLFVDCDFNSNGEITFSYPSPDEETACRDNCLLHDGAKTIVAKTVIFPPRLLQQQGFALNDCQGGGDCASGVCGPQNLCMVTCPWEAAIEGIDPNCVEFRVPQGTVCSELSTMRQFGQWSVAMDGGSGPLINLLSQESLVDFDPAAIENLGMTIEYLQGNLRQVRAARPRWIVLVGQAEADSPPSMKP